MEEDQDSLDSLALIDRLLDENSALRLELAILMALKSQRDSLADEPVGDENLSTSTVR